MEIFVSLGGIGTENLDSGCPQQPALLPTARPTAVSSSYCSRYSSLQSRSTIISDLWFGSSTPQHSGNLVAGAVEHGAFVARWSPIRVVSQGLLSGQVRNTGTEERRSVPTVQHEGVRTSGCLVSVFRLSARQFPEVTEELSTLQVGGA